ncbi:MAG: ExbD/TolR family protein [Saprospiraceae bacterium]
MKNPLKSRLNPQINASSMADIAFLLLIFFLTTTEIVNEKGLLVKLPPWDVTQTDVVHPPPRNVFSVLVNDNDELLVRGERIPLGNLKQRAKEFIANPDQLSTLPQNPKRAIISLKNDRGTSYATYIGVYNELQAAYNELWNEAAQKRYGKPYSENLSREQRNAIRADIPMVLSEAEPTDISIQ